MNKVCLCSSTTNYVMSCRSVNYYLYFRRMSIKKKKKSLFVNYIILFQELFEFIISMGTVIYCLLNIIHRVYNKIACKHGTLFLYCSFIIASLSCTSVYQMDYHYIFLLLSFHISSIIHSDLLSYTVSRFL